jgi:hypothetical protein
MLNNAYFRGGILASVYLRNATPAFDSDGRCFSLFAELKVWAFVHQLTLPPSQTT